MDTSTNTNTTNTDEINTNNSNTRRNTEDNRKLLRMKIKGEAVRRSNKQVKNNYYDNILDKFAPGLTSQEKDKVKKEFENMMKTK